MKFTTAWAEIATQNVTLKVAIALLSLICVTLAITATKLALREPLIIDRACESTAVLPANLERTEAEIRAFVERALDQRFNTSATDTGFLASKELEARKTEQGSLTSKGITQRIFVNKVSIEKDRILVDTDRLISVDKIRSAFPFPLVLQLSKVSRTTSNPYGLVLNSVEQVKADEEKK